MFHYNRLGSNCSTFVRAKLVSLPQYRISRILGGKLGRLLPAVLAAAAACAPYSALASDTPLYQPAPAWVLPAVMPPNTSDSPPLLILDFQHRIEDGRLWSYVDQATRISTPEILAQAATLTIPWAPDKGDLLIHELSILRGEQKIDLIANGQKFTVLRREQALEQRELTGILTATIAVEGLQVGDVLQLRATVTAKDDALAGRVQDIMPIIAQPARVGFARMRFSWPTNAAPRWKIIADGVKGVPVRKGAYTEMTLSLPAPKQPEMPEDAPSRFRRSPLIELATFSDWADVSKTMATLYRTEHAILPGSPVAAEVAAIMASEATAIGRAQRALQLVQDKIRYLAIGMDGGNYIPPKPTRTWELRYGDCKAKTLLLIAMLHAMNIEAEPVLANVGLSDFVPERLPSAGAFNHIFVRAVIDGETFWLDGTGSGSRIADIRDTPPFQYVLPVRLTGADLIKIDAHANARPMIDLSVDADESVSVELPSAFHATLVVHGPQAAAIALAKTQLGEKEQGEAVRQFLQQFIGEGQYTNATITPDSASGDVTLRANGVVTTPWATEDRRRKRAVTYALSGFDFAPDRSKPSWAEIPVAVNPPQGMRYRLRLKLPDNGRGFAIDGETNLKERLAGFNLSRSMQMDGGIVTLDERFDSLGGEIAAKQIPAERDAVATAKARSPRIVAPVDTARRWTLTASEMATSTQVKAIRAVFDKVIKDDPEEATGYTSRAAFLNGTGDRRGALADMGRAIAIAPSVSSYLQRAAISYELGDVKSALADAEAARALDPASGDAIQRVSYFDAELGNLGRGIALLDQRIALGGETRSFFREAKASLIGDFGDVHEAIKLYDILIAEKPGSPSLMNGRCWIKATHSVMLDTALKDCTSAIELSSDTTGPLDSRALVWYRSGRYDEALADLDAVLAAWPGQANSRFLRAAVLKMLHRDAESVKDVAIARRIKPSIDREYGRYGIRLP
jgi:tetratricopeptide (TPR) repeat protein